MAARTATTLQCDTPDCEATRDGLSGDVRLARSQAKADGWQLVNAGGVQMDLCPACAQQREWAELQERHRRKWANLGRRER